ncbi:MAG: dienelactone hydrolase family protein [Proteobacteria bacterium]|uniref:alpha/beta hydrolase family protein n=1 Tax=Rudaea sp. TaxID=2136325 RepID=UPI00321FEEDE|nr:dienelactone hydrolase family protein [Pseudomonadota bacterium]
MKEKASRALTIAVDADIRVSALFQAPDNARACYVLAHGAGAGMTHPFMAALAAELSLRDVATLRYQFPYMERGSGRPDAPKLAHATVRAAVAAATGLAPGLALIAGGKSFGARMTSQAQALDPLPRVAGLAFVGFPLHPPKKLSIERAEHLFGVRVPMLFLQGTRDELAERRLMAEMVDRLGALSEIEWFDDADHAFHVRKSSGSSDAQVLAGLAQAIADFAARLRGS